jgi:hypothetical protein
MCPSHPPSREELVYPGMLQPTAHSQRGRKMPRAGSTLCICMNTPNTRRQHTFAVRNDSAMREQPRRLALRACTLGISSRAPDQTPRCNSTRKTNVTCARLGPPRVGAPAVGEGRFEGSLNPGRRKREVKDISQKLGILRSEDRRYALKQWLRFGTARGRAPTPSQPGVPHRQVLGSCPRRRQGSRATAPR